MTEKKPLFTSCLPVSATGPSTETCFSVFSTGPLTDSDTSFGILGDCCAFVVLSFCWRITSIHIYSCSLLNFMYIRIVYYAEYNIIPLFLIFFNLMVAKPALLYLGLFTNSFLFFLFFIIDLSYWKITSSVHHKK